MFSRDLSSATAMARDMYPNGKCNIIQIKSLKRKDSTVSPSHYSLQNGTMGDAGDAGVTPAGGTMGDLTDEGNPQELKDEDAETVKSAGNMLKGLAAAHDMPEHHKSALDMHGDALHKALGEGGAAAAMAKAVKHMKSLADDAPDVPEHHKDALNFHAKTMAKCMKALEPEEKDDDDTEEKAEPDAGRKSVEDEPTEKSHKVSALDRAFADMMRISTRVLN